MTLSVMVAQQHTGCQQGKNSETAVVKADGPGHCLDQIPGLTEEQKKQIKAMAMAFHKELALIDAQIDEKKAHLKTLELAETPDMAAIGKTIDEMMVLKGDIMKKKIAHHQEIRKMLNDEQKVFFDQHMNKKCKGKKGKGKGCGDMNMGHNCGSMGMGHGNGDQKCCGDGQMKSTGCSGQGAQTGPGCKGAGK